MNADEQWLREELAEAVPPAPASPERLAGVTDRRRRHQRRTMAAGVLATGLTIAVVSLAGRTLLPDDAAPGPAPTVQTSATEEAQPTLACPAEDTETPDKGPGTLEPGPVAARLCGGAGGIDPPLDTLRSGLDALVSSINSQPSGFDGCHGPFGADYLLLLGYTDDTVRRVRLSFSGCGSIGVGKVSRLNPQEPFDEFIRLVREQRADSTPPASTQEPVCVPDGESSALGHRGAMRAALLCVQYEATMSGSREQSVPIPADDLATLLTDWRGLPDKSGTKTDGCSPVTPSWTISGVNAWGDRLSIEAECGVFTPGCDTCRPGPAAQAIVDRLVRVTGFPHPTVGARTSAYYVAAAYIDLVNFGFRDDAAALWAGQAWLPPAGQVLDWHLQEVHPTSLDGWEKAQTMAAYYYEAGVQRFVQLTLARKSAGEPWSIVTLQR